MFVAVEGANVNAIEEELLGRGFFFFFDFSATVPNADSNLLFRREEARLLSMLLLKLSSKESKLLRCLCNRCFGPTASSSLTFRLTKWWRLESVKRLVNLGFDCCCSFWRSGSSKSGLYLRRKIELDDGEPANWLSTLFCRFKKNGISVVIWAVKLLFGGGFSIPYGSPRKWL